MPRASLSAEFALILDSAVSWQVVSAFSQQHLLPENIAICTAKAIPIPALDPGYERKFQNNDQRASVKHLLARDPSHLRER